MKKALSLTFVSAVFILGMLLITPTALPQAQQAKAVTTPKEHFGFNLGDDYCLANYQQLMSYWKKLESQIGPAQGRQHRHDRRGPAAAHGHRHLAGQSHQAGALSGISPAAWPGPRASAPPRPPSWPPRARRSSGSTAACTPAKSLCAQMLIETLVPVRHGQRSRVAAHSRRRHHPLRPRQSRRHGPGRRPLHEQRQGSQAALRGRLAAALSEIHRPRQQPRFLRQHPGRDQEHEPRHVSRVVPADRLQPPSERARRDGACFARRSAIRPTTTSIPLVTNGIDARRGGDDAALPRRRTSPAPPAARAPPIRPGGTAACAPPATSTT